MTSESHEAIVESQFGPRARAYLASAVHASGEDLDLMVNVIGNRPSAIAIDMGCGGGHAAFRLAPLVGEVIAYDLSEAMLAVVAGEAKLRGHGNLKTAQGIAEKLPYAPATFDVAVSRYSAHHWRDLPKGLGQMRQVLKPGALAVLIDVISPAVPLLDTWLQATELLRDPSHVRDNSLPEWLAMLGAAGFVSTQVATFRLRLEFGPWIERMAPPEAHVLAIRSLQRGAASDVINHFAIEQDGTFTVDTALIVARAGMSRDGDLAKPQDVPEHG